MTFCRRSARTGAGQIQKTPIFCAEIGAFAKLRLALGVLWTLARLAQTDFLALNPAGITRYKARLAQFATQGFVIFDQGTGNAMTDSTGLAGGTATGNRDKDIKLLA